MSYPVTLNLNRPQITGIWLQAIYKVDIWGRGTGKSFSVGWDVDLINKTMPRAVTSVTGQTYGQLLTRTLPSTFKYLESVGYKRHQDARNPGNYKIGGKPPAHWIDPYEKIMKYDNFISFSNGNGLLMLSQDRAGSGRGPNTDYELVDEALTINKQRYDEETSPTNRGNEDHFGKKSKNPIPYHHGFHYVSSMPYTAEQKWLLDYGNYYEEEAGIRLFEIWNRAVNLQLELLKCETAKEYKEIWNETIRLKKQIAPFVSKEGVLFTLANAFDNIENVGFSYIKREYEKQTLLTFLVEIMNIVLDKVEDCYYHIDDQKHIYHDAYNDSFIRDYAENTEWDWNKLGSPDSRFDLDCNPKDPLEIVFDWGSRISLMSVNQPRGIDFVTKLMTPTQNFINEFFVKPDDTPSIMINDLIDEFCQYYRYHVEKTVFYYRDRYGDHTQANSSRSYNEQAIARLEKNGWTVVAQVHRGMEPPHHDKYLLWNNILKEADDRFPKVRFNGQKCKYTLISLNNTKVIEKDGKFKKDKKSEHINSGVLPEEATHFGDACDKIMWTKFGDTLYNSSTFIPARLGSK